MASSYLNIVTFLLTTVFYYLVLKPKLSFDSITNASKYKEYNTNNNLYLVIYFFLVILIQFIVNASIISSSCGGNLTQNLAASGTLTFIPWTLIFGIVIIVLLIYPGVKSAFSDVIGYYYVSGAANRLLTDLLINTQVNEKINNATTQQTSQATPAVPLSPTPLLGGKQIGGATKKDLEDAADMIIKICGNSALLINQMSPNNFQDYWTTLKPLLKDKYQSDAALADVKRDELFELVVTKDNVGEAMWYIYTGLLLTSITQLKISTRGCVSNPAEIAKNYQSYLENQEEIDAKQKQASSTVYTITN